MSDKSHQEPTSKPPLIRLIAGGMILIIGFLIPLLIPVVLATSWSDGLKAIVSGGLAFGIPELFMIIAVAVMGKDGFDFIKAQLGKLLKPLAPPDEVSKSRYNIGLIMFFVPILFGFIAPYMGNKLPIPQEHVIYYNIGGDVMIFLSLFILGGNFWDKLRSLFVHKAKAHFPKSS